MVSKRLRAIEFSLFFRYKFVDATFGDFLNGECKIFIYFDIQFGVGKLSKYFLFVKVGAPSSCMCIILYLNTVKIFHNKGIVVY